MDECKNCGGRGYIIVAGHDDNCDGTEKKCSKLCPVPVQEVCPECMGTGETHRDETFD